MAPLTSGFSSRSWASSSEGVLALSGEALAQAVAAGFLVHAANATVSASQSGRNVPVRPI